LQRSNYTMQRHAQLERLSLGFNIKGF